QELVADLGESSVASLGKPDDVRGEGTKRERAKGVTEDATRQYGLSFPLVPHRRLIHVQLEGHPPWTRCVGNGNRHAPEKELLAAGLLGGQQGGVRRVDPRQVFRAIDRSGVVRSRPALSVLGFPVGVALGHEHGLTKGAVWDKGPGAAAAGDL